jgi:mono/diheme cytochrome c family protein
MTLRSSRMLVAVAALAATTAIAQAQVPRTVQDGVYSSAQAARGVTVYSAQCASCHGASLQGASGPPLQGEPFVSHWQTEPLSSLLSKIRNTMPADAPGQLTPQQSADLVAHLLNRNGFAAGTAELAGTEAATKGIRWPQRAATGTAVPAGAVRPPVGNLAQLMRGIFFPNSNLIFAVQQQDPGAAKGPNNLQAGTSTYFDWGMGIYTGWQVVDNAAIALADISPLMLNPGLRCENGRPAPVGDPDWIKFTDQMITMSKEIYRLSQTRNQEAVSDATGDLSDTCAVCHGAYRDVRGRGAAPNPADPQANASRCMSRR